MDREEDFDGEVTYTPRICYVYRVGDMVYEPNRTQFGWQPTQSQRGAQKLVDKYPVDMTVSVYYDPQNPQSAVLEPGKTGMGIGMMVMGLVFFVISLVVWFTSMAS